MMIRTLFKLPSYPHSQATMNANLVHRKIYPRRLWKTAYIGTDNNKKRAAFIFDAGEVRLFSTKWIRSVQGYCQMRADCFCILLINVACIFGLVT